MLSSRQPPRCACGLGAPRLLPSVRLAAQHLAACVHTGEAQAARPAPSTCFRSEQRGQTGEICPPRGSLLCETPRPPESCQTEERAVGSPCPNPKAQPPQLGSRLPAAHLTEALLQHLVLPLQGLELLLGDFQTRFCALGRKGGGTQSTRDSASRAPGRGRGSSRAQAPPGGTGSGADSQPGSACPSAGAGASSASRASRRGPSAGALPGAGSACSAPARPSPGAPPSSACPPSAPAGTGARALGGRHAHRTPRRSAHVSLALNSPGMPVPRDHAAVQGTPRGILHCASPITTHAWVTVTLPAPCGTAPRALPPGLLPTPPPTLWLGRRPDRVQPQVWTGQLAGRGPAEHS